MIWGTVVCFIGLIAIPAVVGVWCHWTNSRCAALAEKAIRSEIDGINKKTQQAADRMLRNMIAGSEPEKELGELQTATSGLIPGFQGSMPSGAKLKSFADRRMREEVSAVKRKTLTAFILVVSVSAVICLLVCAILYQYYSTSNGGPHVNADSARAPSFNFAEPIITTENSQTHE